MILDYLNDHAKNKVKLKNIQNMAKNFQLVAVACGYAEDENKIFDTVYNNFYKKVKINTKKRAERSCLTTYSPTGDMRIVAPSTKQGQNCNANVLASSLGPAHVLLTANLITIAGMMSDETFDYLRTKTLKAYIAGLTQKMHEQFAFMAIFAQSSNKDLNTMESTCFDCDKLLFAEDIDEEMLKIKMHAEIKNLTTPYLSLDEEFSSYVTGAEFGEKKWKRRFLIAELISKLINEGKHLNYYKGLHKLVKNAPKITIQVHKAGEEITFDPKLFKMLEDKEKNYKFIVPIAGTTELKENVDKNTLKKLYWKTQI